jgi:hypothetical protein
MARIRSSGQAFDTRELVALEADLKAAPLRLQVNMGQVLQRAGRTLQDEMQQDARDGRRSNPSRIKHLPKSVTWERTGLFELEAGIDPKRGSQGPLGHIIVHGSVNNAPIYDYTAAGRRAVPRVEQWAADGAEDAVLGDD